MFYLLLLSLTGTYLSDVAKADVQAITIEGQTITGKWAGIDAEGTVHLHNGDKPNAIPSANLMMVCWPEKATSKPASIQPAGLFIQLSDGSAFRGELVEGSARQIGIRTESAGALNIPLSDIAGIRFSNQAHAEAAEAFTRALAKRDPAEDILFVLRNQQVTTVRGIVESISPQGISFQYRQRSRTIKPADAFALVLAKGVQPASTPPIRCLLRDGSIWAGQITAADPQKITLALAGGSPLNIPVTTLAEIRFNSDRVVFLSDLEPASYQFEPFASTQWPYRRDRSVANRPLRIGKQRYQRGIGMHSQATLTYTLDGDYTSLAAEIGIDEEVGPRGNVVFRILTDDKEVFNSGPVTGRDQPHTLLVPIKGSKQLQLIVEFGDELDIGDHADWGNARLIK